MNRWDFVFYFRAWSVSRALLCSCRACIGVLWVCSMEQRPKPETRRTNQTIPKARPSKGKSERRSRQTPASPLTNPCSIPAMPHIVTLCSRAMSTNQPPAKTKACATRSKKTTHTFQPGTPPFDRVPMAYHSQLSCPCGFLSFSGSCLPPLIPSESPKACNPFFGESQASPALTRHRLNREKKTVCWARALSDPLVDIIYSGVSSF